MIMDVESQFAIIGLIAGLVLGFFIGYLVYYKERNNNGKPNRR